jgi:hypothetical protein
VSFVIGLVAKSSADFLTGSLNNQKRNKRKACEIQRSSTESQRGSGEKVVSEIG